MLKNNQIFSRKDLNYISKMIKIRESVKKSAKGTSAVNTTLAQLFALLKAAR
jgi:hypothetical protein